MLLKVAERWQHWLLLLLLLLEVVLPLECVG
jgi:hypothetical protein